MGGVVASEERKREMVMDKEIGRNQLKEKRRDGDVVKMLMIGPKDSGKTTILNQMRILYDAGYDDGKLRYLVPAIHSTVILGIRAILDNECELQEQYRNIMDNVDADSLLTQEIGDQIGKLWSDPAFQTLKSNRTNQSMDSLNYFCSDQNLRRVCQSGYIPTKLDAAYARIRNNGIVEEKYVIDGVQYTFFDVSGMRTERKKWIHYFEDVTALVFVVSMSEYDQVEYEDDTATYMDEAVKLFDELCNSMWFKKTPIILILNKKDLFEEKLFHIPYRVPGLRNDDFKGPNASDPGVDRNVAIDAATNHMLKRFESCNRQDREIYYHAISASDQRGTRFIFQCVSPFDVAPESSPR